MKNRSRILRQFDTGSASAAIILLLMVAAAPLYFASVLPREKIALQIGAFMALAAVVAGRQAVDDLRTVWRPALAIAAIGVLGILQSVAWPLLVTSTLAGGIADTWASAAELTGEASRFAPLSLSPTVSRSAGIHWLALAACLAAAGIVGRERYLRRLLVGSILVLAVFEIVYGSDNWFARRGTMWGTEVGGDPTRLRGTFVNPDHLATYLILAASATFALLWWSVRRVQQRGAVERRLLQAVLPCLLFLMLFVGLAFTGSRAGSVALLVALVAQALMLAVHYRRWQVGLLVAGALVVGLVGIGLFGLQRGLGRWMETSAYEITWNSRIEAWVASWDLWIFSPFTGTGLGTFRQAFPQVQPSDLGGTWIHAHSDVLELLVTVGIVGLIPAIWGLAAIIRRLWTVFQLGRRSEDRAAGLAASGALIGVLAHSAVEFGLTIPANAFTLAILCGLACGARTFERRSPSAETQEASRTSPG